MRCHFFKRYRPTISSHHLLILIPSQIYMTYFRLWKDKQSWCLKNQSIHTTPVDEPMSCETILGYAIGHTYSNLTFRMDSLCTGCRALLSGKSLLTAITVVVSMAGYLPFSKYSRGQCAVVPGWKSTGMSFLLGLLPTVLWLKWHIILGYMFTQQQCTKKKKSISFPFLFKYFLKANFSFAFLKSFAYTDNNFVKTSKSM